MYIYIYTRTNYHKITSLHLCISPPPCSSPPPSSPPPPLCCLYLHCQLRMQWVTPGPEPYGQLRMQPKRTTPGHENHIASSGGRWARLGPNPIASSCQNRMADRQTEDAGKNVRIYVRWNARQNVRIYAKKECQIKCQNICQVECQVECKKTAR